MRLAIFGCGYIYEKYKNLIPSEDEIAVLLDNDVTYHGHRKDGYIRIYPREVKEYDIDRIILMSDKAAEMREQLLRLSYPAGKIIHYREYLGESNQENQIFFQKYSGDGHENTLLIISNKLGYHGGSVVSYRTALKARTLGYRVTIVASYADEAFLKEVMDSGIEVIIQHNLECSSEEKLEWTKRYDVVLVNTFPMVLCAIKIAKDRKVYLWLHENPDSYQVMEYWHDEIQKGLCANNIEIFAVTERAKENLLRFYVYQKDIKIMPVPIFDFYDKSDTAKNGADECLAVFLSGAVIERKGCSLALDALGKLNAYGKICLYLAGKNIGNEYSQKVLERIYKREDCSYLGEKSMKEIMKLYPMMDVVIVPSKEETFSMAAAEGMMMGKTCIVSDHCGIAEYIENGVNGFVFTSESADALAKILVWCMENREELREIGNRARETYERCFSYSVFELNLRRLMLKEKF